MEKNSCKLSQKTPPTTCTTSTTVALIAVAVALLAAAGLVAEARILAAHNSEPHQLLGRQPESAPEPASHAGEPRVATSSGKLIGIRQPLVQLAKAGGASGNEATAHITKFLAVPYAQAPVGPLRFKRPLELPSEQAEQVREATQFGKTCPQFRHLTRFMNPLLKLDLEHQISEDCLQLNIFVPSMVDLGQATNGSAQAASNKFQVARQVPVIVWLPGEGFDFADARQFDGSHLAHQSQSIVVTVQYRVGVLGFLSAPKLGIAGNMGLHDQLMALKWVQKNIHLFGGNPKQITLMGRFTGSMSISALITAPKREQLLTFNGEPLFQRVALLSGIAVNNWIIKPNQDDKVEQILDEALKHNHCTKAQARNASCLQSLTMEQLLSYGGHGWRLVEDNELIASQVDPLEAIRRGQFASQVEAVLLGETSAEGTLCLFRHMLMDNNYAKLLEENRLTREHLSEMIQDDAGTYFGLQVGFNNNNNNGSTTTTDTNPLQLALEALVDSSDADPEATNSDLRQKYLAACSSYMVTAHSKRFKRYLMEQNHRLERDHSRALRKPVEIYHYELNYKPSFALAPSYVKTASHGDDIPLIFGLLYSQPKQSVAQADLLMTQKMMAYLGNFVHGYDPLMGARSKPTDEHPGNDSIAGRGLAHVNPEDQRQEDSFASILAGSSDIASPEATRKSWLDRADGSKHSFRLTRPAVDSLEGGLGSAGPQITDLSPAGGQLDTSVAAQPDLEPAPHHSHKVGLRVLLMRAPSSISGGQQLIEYHHSLAAASQMGEESALASSNQSVEQATRLRLELHNRSNYQSTIVGQQQPSVTINLISESPLASMLLISASMLILGLIFYCSILSLIVFRRSLAIASQAACNPSAANGAHQFASSSSSCNICDDSHAGTIDAVLGSGPNKTQEGRGFCNVFAKLRPSRPLPTGPPQTTTPSQANATSNQGNLTNGQPAAPQRALAGPLANGTSNTTLGLVDHR